MRFRDNRFRRDQRFIFALQNMIIRWRALSNGRVFLAGHPELKSLSADEMREKLRDPRISASVTAFSSSLRGTSAYWRRKRRELEALIQTVGVPHLFITLSSADRYWPELREFWQKEFVEKDDNADDDKDAAAADLTECLVNDPAVADTVFWLRFEKLVEIFFKKHWGVQNYWFRVEYQSRGSPHVHGLLWLPDGLDLRDPPLTPDQLAAFTDRYVTCVNTGMVDGTVVVATPQSGGVDVPATLRVNQIVDNEIDLAVMLNMSLRHTRCGRYCQRVVKGKTICRFNYPRELKAATEVKKLAPCHWSIEPKRNDSLIGFYNPQLLSTWRANIDVQPIRSPRDVARYLVKYTAKEESDSHHLAAVRQQAEGFARGKTAQTAVQQALLKHIAGRDISAQEACHHLLLTPMINTSKTYVTVCTDQSRPITGRGVGESHLDIYSARSQKAAKMTMHEYFACVNIVGGSECFRGTGNEAILVVNPPLKPHESDPARREQFYRQQMLLYSVWREDEEEVKGAAATWEEAFRQRPPRCPLSIRHISELMTEDDGCSSTNNNNNNNNNNTGELTPELTAANAESVGPRLQASWRQPDWMLHLGSVYDSAMDADDSRVDEEAARAFDWCAASAHLPVEQVADFQDRLRNDEAEVSSAEGEADPAALNSDQLRVFNFMKSKLREEERERKEKT
jgi:hypothetical protein